MKWKLIYLLFFSSISLLAQQREFQIKELPFEWSIENEIVKIKDELNFYDLTLALPENYVKDGSVDYTNYIQKSLDLNRKVKFPAFPILINEYGLRVSSESDLFFPEGAQLKLLSNDKSEYEILRLHNVSNIIIINPNILGDRDLHFGSEGEWGMGISIRGSDNIRIYNPIISKCWGDGIYLGHYKNKQVNNVELYGGFINNNRRNGISITSGNNILVDGVIISNTVGTAPESGIKIEPSNSNAELNEITIKNVKTFNNKNSGIGFGGIELLINKTQNPINISVINHIDIGSYDGFFIGRILRPEKLPGASLKGKLNIVNPKWENNTNASFIKRKHYGRGPTIYFSKLSSKLKKELWRAYKYDIDVRFLESDGKIKTLSKY